MQAQIQKEEQNSLIKYNYYILNYNEKISHFISNIISIYQKNKEVLINTIFFDEESLNLIFISFLKKNFYLTVIPVSPSMNKLLELPIVLPENEKFSFKNMKLSEDKKHIVLFNDGSNKLFIIFDYFQKINLYDKIVLENSYSNKEYKIIDIKFNCNNISPKINKSDDSLIDNESDIILYGIKCNNENLSLFNSKYLNREFIIFFNEPYIDFQLIFNSNSRGYDLYIMNSFGNFLVAKDINDINNIPKSDKSELFQKIKLYDKIIQNINVAPILSKIEYIKFCFQPQNSVKNIATVIRLNINTLEIGAIVNNKLFLFKKYCFYDISISNNDREEIKDIIPRKNYINQYLIKSNKSLYLLDAASLDNLCIPLTGDYISKDQKKQDILLNINEMISNITISKLLNFPLNQDNKYYSIIYNFYQGSIFFIKKDKNNKYTIKVYDIEVDIGIFYQNESNNSAIYNNKQKSNEEIIFMQDLLNLINIEINDLKQSELDSKKKGENCNKMIEECTNNINSLYLQNNNINTSNGIDHLNESYINLYKAIKLYGQVIQDKYDTINKSITEGKEIENNFKKSTDKVNTSMKSIDDKLKIIEENQKKLTDLRNENNNLMFEYYLKHMNENNKQKKFCTNELVGRINNQILHNMKILQEKFQNNSNNLDKLNFEQLKNFPLTMKYMNNYQKEKCYSMINSIKNLISTLEKFKENLKSVDENAK